MKVEGWSILQYFWPALSDNWFWNQIFGLFESGRFTKGLLYNKTAYLLLQTTKFILYISNTVVSTLRLIWVTIPH